MPSRAVLTEVQTIPNADIVQALGNLKITATSGITTTFPATASTLAGLSVANTFTAAQSFSSTINLVATTSTAGYLLQASKRYLHSFNGVTNVFLGSEAGNLLNTLTGTANVGIGRISLQSLTSGNYNACVGDQAGSVITTGSSNMLFGYAAGNLITTGSSNCAIGVFSLTSCVGTSSNSALGYQSLGSMTGGSSTGIGHNAGYYATGNKNTFLGQAAGIDGTSITSATNCTMLGQGSGSTSATNSYQTAIGSDSRCNAANAIKLGRDASDRVIFPSWTADPASDLVVGMVIFRSDTSTLKVYTSTGWKTITAA